MTKKKGASSGTGKREPCTERKKHAHLLKSRAWVRGRPSTVGDNYAYS